MKFSANLGFLWADMPLAAAIRAAKAAGFDAVECHWPYDEPAMDVCAALEETGLPMLGLNTRRGGAGENGLSALPGRGEEARAAVDEALGFADAVGAGSVHVMAGFAEGPDAHRAFGETLTYAAKAAGTRTILIEPLNRHDAPGYFLKTTDQARKIIREVGADNLRLMFDCYHVGRTEGDVVTRFADLRDVVGHVQFASVPTRGAPDEGELDYRFVFKALSEAGWDAPLGAEYKPGGPTEPTLGWMKTLTTTVA